MALKTQPEEVTADIRRLAKELGRQPKSADYRARGRFAHCIPTRLFGSWRAAIEAAGLVYQGKVIDPLADLKKVAEKIGRIPAYKEYREAGGKHHGQQFYKLVPGSPGWTSVLMACFGINEDEARGYSKVGANFGTYRTTKDRLEELRNLAAKLRHVPTLDEAKKHGLNTRLLLRRLGSWLKTTEAAGLGKPQSRKRPGEHLTPKECLDEVYRVFNLLRHFPTQVEFKKHGRVCCLTVARRVTGTNRWAAVRRLADPNYKRRRGEIVDN